MKILIICNPDEGRATELTIFLKCEAERMNRRVVVLNAQESSKTPDHFDAVVVVAEMNGKYFGNTIQDYISRNFSFLNNTPTFFLSVVACEDENNLKISEREQKSLREFMTTLDWKPSQVLLLPVGSRLQENQFVTLTDWPELKISLQRFLIRNDLMMAS